MKWTLIALEACCLIFGMASLLRPMPHLIDQCGRPASATNSAPIVIVGTIASDIQVSRPIPMHSDPSYPLQLRKLKIRIENILKGDLTKSTIVVYYFAFAGGFDGPQPLGTWNVGGRRIFWLREDSGVLRTACDGWDYCTWGVFSGAHPHYTIDANRPIGYALADILLTRGEGPIHDAKFAGALERGAPSTYEYLVEKFRQLALTETSAVKNAACTQLWIAAHDAPAPPAILKLSKQTLEQAHCHCATKSERITELRVAVHQRRPALLNRSQRLNPKTA